MIGLFCFVLFEFIVLGSRCIFSTWTLSPSITEKFHDSFDSFPCHLFLIQMLSAPAPPLWVSFLHFLPFLFFYCTFKNFPRSNFPAFLLNYFLFWKIYLYYLGICLFRFHGGSNLSGNTCMSVSFLSFIVMSLFHVERGLSLKMVLELIH